MQPTWNNRLSVVNDSKGSRSREFLSALKGDLLPSIAVFLVALPLCMGIAIASGAPVAAGLITGIVGGIIVGLLAGAPLQVSGPAAGLSVIVYGTIQQYGFEALGIIVLIAGVAQLAAGALRVGQWFRAVSPAVIHGMLAGIGILILASQFHVMVDDAPKKSGLENLITIPEAIAKGLPLPRASSAEERQERTRILKHVASLQQRQHSNLDAAVAASAAGATVAGEQASALIENQREITATLREIHESMETGLAPLIYARAKPAAEQALTSSDAALAALRDGKVELWRESQRAAADGLQGVLMSVRSHDWAAKIGLLTIVVLIGWQAFRPRRLRAVPAPLVAVALASFIVAAWQLPVLCVEVPDSLWSAIRFPSIALFEELPILGLIQAGLVIAMIASAETLLCATAVDQMHNGPRTNYDRELMAQGVGNSICGVLGALPMTGVIVRSAANVQAGARTRFSAVMHGLWLFLFVALLAFLLQSIPIASLAAVLVYTGYKLVNIDGLKKLRKYGWGEVLIYMSTVTVVVAVDLLAGVLTGIALSALKLLYTFSHLRAELTPEPHSNRVVLSLQGTATFLRLPLLAARLEQVPANAELHVDFEQLEYIDHACLDLLMTWAKQHQATGGTLVIDWDSLHANFHRAESGRPKAVA